MQIRLDVSWHWQPNDSTRVYVQYVPFNLGYNSPAAALLQGGLHLEGAVAQKAESLANILAQLEKPAQPISLGGREFECIIKSISALDGSVHHIQVVINVQYPPYDSTAGIRGRLWQHEELPDSPRLLADEIRRIAEKESYSQLYSKFGANTVDAEKWKAKKREVFISYRGSRGARAMELFHALGDYENKTVFLPRIDKVDLQAGDWLSQLESFIGKAPCFLPLLTPDYLSGPIARPEVDLALRQNFENSTTKRLVPVLLEGNTSHYKNTFLGGYHIYDARGGHFDEAQINDIANLLLGVSRNPYG